MTAEGPRTDRPSQPCPACSSCSRCRRQRPRLLRGAPEAAFPRARDRRRRSFLEGDAARAERRHPAHLRPDDARRGVRQCAQAEMGAGARHRRRRHHRPALARQARHRHQHPRHPRRAGVGGRDHGHAGALAATCRARVRSQDENSWTRWPPRLLDNKTVGIYGIGLIAEALAPRCKAFGMTVWSAISSTKREVPGFDRMLLRERADRDCEGARLSRPARPLLGRDAAFDRRATCSPR